MWLRVEWTAWLVLGCLGSAAMGRAAGRPAASVPELATDRPDFTDTAIVVPRGSLQLESGFTAGDGDKESRKLDAPEALLRWGIGRRTELRFGPPGFFRIRGGGERAAGFGDTYLGFKQQLGPVWGGLDLSLIPGVSLPTGAGGVTSEGVDPEVKLTWSRELAPPWSVGGSFGFFWPTDAGRHNFTWVPAFEVGRSLGGRWKTFLEYAGGFPARGDSQHLLHHGYTYALTPVSQADLHVGFGLSSGAPGSFFAGGFSARY